MKKILIISLLCLILVSTNSLYVFAETEIIEKPNIKIIIDGKMGAYSNSPIIVKGRTLLPLRALLVNLGVQNDNDHIIWKAAENSVEIKKGDVDICLKVGDISATVSDVITTLDVAPVNYRNRVYIPAGFVAQSFGKAVFWDSTLSRVHIITPSKGSVSVDSQNESSNYASLAYDLEDKQGKPDEAVL